MKENDCGSSQHPSPNELVSERGSTTNSRRLGLVTARPPEQREADTTDLGARTPTTAPWLVIRRKPAAPIRHRHSATRSERSCRNRNTI